MDPVGPLCMCLVGLFGDSCMPQFRSTSFRKCKKGIWLHERKEEKMFSSAESEARRAEGNTEAAGK